MEQKQEIQTLLNEVQHLLHQAEIRAEQMAHMGARDPKLEESLDIMQRMLVDLQLAFVGNKEGEELLQAFFRDGTSSDQCEVEWIGSDRVLKIFIPDSWERVNTRPGIYIKDILKNRNSIDVKLFYSRLLQAILCRKKNEGKLDGFEMFKKCYAGFLFHFQDQYVRDPDNFTIKVLVDAAKMANIFYTDDYEHLVYCAAGVLDKNKRGLTLFFSDSYAALEHLLSDVEQAKADRNYIRLKVEKQDSFLEAKERMWF